MANDTDSAAEAGVEGEAADGGADGVAERATPTTWEGRGECGDEAQPATTSVSDNTKAAIVFSLTRHPPRTLSNVLRLSGAPALSSG